MGRFGFAFGFLALIALAQDTPIRREGNYWVQVITGALPASENCNLEVQTRGRLTLQGQPADRITYTITKRVRAASEREAHALLRSARIQTAFRPGSATIAFVPSRPDVSAEMVLTGPADLENAVLMTSGGDVEVNDIAGTVHAQTDGGVIQMDRIGSDAVAHTGGGDVRIGSVAGSIRCFSGGGLIQVDRAGRQSWLETEGGDIFVRESAGPIHTSTGGGNIRVQRAGSTVSARTSGGRIEVAEAKGLVFADNSGGSIRVGEAAGVRVASAGGGIQLRGASGSLRAVTDVGSILAELMQGMTLQDSILSTGAGDITVYIPSKIPLTVKAMNQNGAAARVVSEFSEILIRQAMEAAQDGVLAEGALNGGGPVLRLTSTGGTIYLKRQR